jgi:hypothetical protein
MQMMSGATEARACSPRPVCVPPFPVCLSRPTGVFLQCQASVKTGSPDHQFTTLLYVNFLVFHISRLSYKLLNTGTNERSRMARSDGIDRHAASRTSFGIES